MEILISDKTLQFEKPGVSPICETGMLVSKEGLADAYVLAMWCPVFRRHDSYSGFRTELENLFGDAKGKGTSGGPARLNVPMRRRGSDCSIVVTKRSNARGAKGAGHARWDGVNWKQEELTEGGSFHWVARAV